VLVASSYPFLDLMWTILILGLWVMYIWVVIMALTDNFRRRDHSGLAKAVWMIFIILLPVLGVISYFITRPDTADQTLAS
jgi:hypothetical protein